MSEGMALCLSVGLPLLGFALLILVLFKLFGFEEDMTPSDPSKHSKGWEIRALMKGKCPDCGGTLLCGPQGGSAMNVKCEDCGSRFNVCPTPFGETMMGHRL